MDHKEDDEAVPEGRMPPPSSSSPLPTEPKTRRSAALKRLLAAGCDLKGATWEHIRENTPVDDFHTCGFSDIVWPPPPAEAVRRYIDIAPSQSVLPHRHDVNERFQVVGGSAIVRLEDRVFSVGPGSVMEIQCGELHSVRAGADGLQLYAEYDNSDVRGTNWLPGGTAPTEQDLGEVPPADASL